MYRYLRRTTIEPTARSCQITSLISIYTNQQEAVYDARAAPARDGLDIGRRDIRFPTPPLRSSGRTDRDVFHGIGVIHPPLVSGRPWEGQKGYF